MTIFTVLAKTGDVYGDNICIHETTFEKAKAYVEEKERLMAIYGNFVRSTLYIVLKDIDVDEVERLYFAGKTYEFENNLRILKEKVRAKVNLLLQFIKPFLF
jgi:hypothetical protein